MGITGTSRSSAVQQVASSDVLFRWNEVDLSQFEEAYRTPGADGILSVGTNLAEPYQPILEFEIFGGGAARDYVFYRLLDDDGNPLIIPQRARMNCLLGPRFAKEGINYGDNLIPTCWLWYVDENHRIGLHNQNQGGNSNSLQLTMANGNGDPDSYSFQGGNTKTDFRDSGDPVFLDLDMRKPSTGVDPGGIAKFGGDFSDDADNVKFGDSGWSVRLGATPPSTSWSAGWDGPVHAAIGFLKTGAGTGITHISQLTITAPVGFR